MLCERMEIVSDEWPRCEVCDMPVEDFYAMEEPKALIFIAVCHNQTERVEIPNELWDNASLENVSFQNAFHNTK